MTGRLSAAALLLLLGACTTGQGDLVLRDGYRGPDDPCRALGDLFSNDATDNSPDIVACPPGLDPGFDAARTLSIGPQGGYETYYLVP